MVNKYLGSHFVFFYSFKFGTEFMFLDGIGYC